MTEQTKIIIEHYKFLDITFKNNSFLSIQMLFLYDYWANDIENIGEKDKKGYNSVEL